MLQGWGEGEEVWGQTALTRGGEVYSKVNLASAQQSSLMLRHLLSDGLHGTRGSKHETGVGTNALVFYYFLSTLKPKKERERKKNVTRATLIAY